jgi:hypothetical protein
VKKVNKVRSLAGFPECPSKPSLAERPLLGIETAAELARVYETLANDTRLRLLHVLLKEGELSKRLSSEAWNETASGQ